MSINPQDDTGNGQEVPLQTALVPSTSTDTREKPVLKGSAAPAAGAKIEMSNKTAERYQKLSPSGKAIIEFMMDYVNKMRPRKPISVSDGVRMQVQLYRHMQNMVNNNAESFKETFTAVLRLIEEFDTFTNPAGGEDYGAFHDTCLYRFDADITLSVDDRKAFRNFMNLIKLLGPIKSREIAKRQVDPVKSLKYGFKPDGVERVMYYFGLEG